MSAISNKPVLRHNPKFKHQRPPTVVSNNFIDHNLFNLDNTTRAGCAIIRLDPTDPNQCQILFVKEVSSGYWGMPKGRREMVSKIFEHPQQTAVRETFEETGLTVSPNDFLEIYQFGDYILYLVANYKGDIQHDPNEISDIKWMRLDEIYEDQLSRFKLPVSATTRVFISKISSSDIMNKYIRAEKSAEKRIKDYQLITEYANYLLKKAERCVITYRVVV